MSLTIRIILIIVSFLTLLYAIRKIRKSHMEMSDVFFWIISSLGLVVLSIFPQIAAFFANLIGIQSELNFLYISIIFVIILKLFSLSIEVSQLKVKLRNLIQETALNENENYTKKEKK